jgi:hypothetical protein
MAKSKHYKNTNANYVRFNNPKDHHMDKSINKNMNFFKYGWEDFDTIKHNPNLVLTKKLVNGTIPIIKKEVNKIIENFDKDRNLLTIHDYMLVDYWNNITKKKDTIDFYGETKIVALDNFNNESAVLIITYKTN